MKFTTVLAVVLVVCVVALEAKKPKANNKLARKELKVKCTKQISYSACNDGNMTRSISLVAKAAEDTAACQQAGKKESKPFPCVSTSPSNKKGCQMVKQFDYTTCANYDGSVPMNMTVTIISREGPKCRTEEQLPSVSTISCDSMKAGPRNAGRKNKTRADKGKENKNQNKKEKRRNRKNKKQVDAAATQ